MAMDPKQANLAAAAFSTLLTAASTYHNSKMASIQGRIEASRISTDIKVRKAQAEEEALIRTQRVREMVASQRAVAANTGMGFGPGFQVVQDRSLSRAASDQSTIRRSARIDIRRMGTDRLLARESAKIFGMSQQSRLFGQIATLGADWALDEYKRGTPKPEEAEE